MRVVVIRIKYGWIGIKGGEEAVVLNELFDDMNGSRMQDTKVELQASIFLRLQLLRLSVSHIIQNN